jgi:hypothetical protein
MQQFGLCDYDCFRKNVVNDTLHNADYYWRFTGQENDTEIHFRAPLSIQLRLQAK